MFDILGYLVSIIIVAFATTLLIEYTKRYSFIQRMVKLFEEKIKKIAWYQVESILIALLILILLNTLNAITIGGFSLILNALIIGFLSNGIFTYQFVKDILSMFKITSKIIENIEKKDSVVTKTSVKKTTRKAKTNK